MAKKSSVVLPEGMTQKQVVEEFLNKGVLKPAELFAAVKEKYGVEIGKPNINQIKVLWKKSKGGVKARVTPKPAPTLFAVDIAPAAPQAAAPKKPGRQPAAPAAAPAPAASHAGTVAIDVAKFVLKFGSVDAAIAELEKLR